MPPRYSRVRCSTRRPPEGTVLNLVGVASGDFNGDGKPDVVSVSFGHSAGLTIQLGNGDGTLQPARTFGYGSLSPEVYAMSQSIQVGDFNGDGKLDVVTTLYDYFIAGGGTASGVVIWLGNGDGTFQAPVAYSTGVNTESVVVADLNADGKPDLLALGGQDPSALIVLLGNGDGTFGAATSYRTGAGTVPLMLAVGDFNGDGKPDAALSDSMGGSVLLMLGNGDGTFGSPTSIVVTTQNVLGAIVAGDFNHDGKQDLLVGTYLQPSGGLNSYPATSQGIFLLVGKGDGTFQTPVNVIPPTATGSTVEPVIVTGDFDGDGNLDFAAGGGAWATAGRPSNYGVLVMKGNGDGTFAAPAPVYVGGAFMCMTAATLRAGSYPSLIVGIQQTVSLSGTSGLTEPTIEVVAPPFPVTYQSNAVNPQTGYHQVPVALAVGDFNGDGVIDIVAPEVQGPVTLLNLGHGTFSTSIAESAQLVQSPAAAVADFNGDGKLDIAVPDNEFVSLYRGHGDGNFTFSKILGSLGPATGLLTADFNGDGKPDLAAIENGTLQIMLNAGDGTFPMPAGGFHSTATNLASTFITADFNGDGKADIAVPADSGDSIAILLGNGDGTLQTSKPTPPLPGRAVGGTSQVLVAADFNGDGKPDLVTLSSTMGGGPPYVVDLLFGNGDGTFQSPVVVPIALDTFSPVLVLAGDFDGDGKQDLILGSDFPQAVVWLRGNGDGTFQSPQAYGTGEPTFLAAGDFQHDGRLSLAISNAHDDNISILLNDSPAVVTGAPTLAITAQPASLTLGQSAVINWSSNNATSCTASGAWSGTQAISGSFNATPAVVGAYTYTLACSGMGGSVTGSATVTVTAPQSPPTVELTASPTAVSVGSPLTLNWSSINATACTASGAWSGTMPTAGTSTQLPASAGTDTYTLTCSGAGGSANASATVTVSTAPSPSVSITVSPTMIVQGQSASLSWSSANATSCMASGAWSGTQSVSGSLVVTPASNGALVYTLTCAGGSGSSGASATLTVSVPAVAVTAVSGRVGGGGALDVATLLALLVMTGLSRVLYQRSEQRVLPSLALAMAVGLLAAPLRAQGDNSVGFDMAHGYVGLRAGESIYQPSMSSILTSVGPDASAITALSIDTHQFGAVLYAGVPIWHSLSLEIGYAQMGQFPLSMSVTTSSAVPEARARSTGQAAPLRTAAISKSVDTIAQAVVDAAPPAGHAATLGVALPVDITSRLSFEPRIAALIFQSKQTLTTSDARVRDDSWGSGFEVGGALNVRLFDSLYLGASVDCFHQTRACNTVLLAAVIEFHFGR